MFEELINALQPKKTVVLCKIEEPALSVLRVLAKGLMLNELNSRAALSEHTFSQVQMMDPADLAQIAESFYDTLNDSFLVTERGKRLVVENDQLITERHKIMRDYLQSKNLSADRNIMFDLKEGQLKEEVPR